MNAAESVTMGPPLRLKGSRFLVRIRTEGSPTEQARWDPLLARSVSLARGVGTLRCISSGVKRLAIVLLLLVLAACALLWRDHNSTGPAELTVDSRPQGAQVYLDDIIGMQALNPDGSSLGTVKEFYELPQGIVLEIVLPAGSKQKEVLVPFNEEVVTSVDSAARRIVVAVPEGLLD